MTDYTTGLWYLATPYTKYHLGTGHAMAEASRLADKLLDDGIVAYSPIAHCYSLSLFGGSNPNDLARWRLHNARMIQICTGLIVAEMMGWASSDGVMEEIQDFTRLGKPIKALKMNGVLLRIESYPIHKPERGDERENARA